MSQLAGGIDHYEHCGRGSLSASAKHRVEIWVAHQRAGLVHILGHLWFLDANSVQCHNSTAPQRYSNWLKGQRYRVAVIDLFC